jgi:putative ABC transport system permease protein
MAWRDSRRSRKRLLLYISSMILGVSALVAITSFGQDMLRAVDLQARELVGADIKFERSAPFAAETEALFDSLGQGQARIVSFASMAYFPRHERSRLSRIRALEGDFPFYGQIEADPPASVNQLRQGNGVLVDDALLLQIGAGVGDSVYVGRRGYLVAGRLLEVPGESAASAFFGPRLFVPLSQLDTLLLSRGSRVEYEAYHKLSEDGPDGEELRELLRPHLEEHDIRVDTVREVRAEWGGALEDLYSFMNLVAFIALLLGGLGVASSVQVYAKQKTDTVATLRCIGASSMQAFSVYVTQAIAMGMIGAVLGVGLGIAIQQSMPIVLADFLPVDVELSFSASAVAEGLLVGLVVSVVFALLPLIRTRLISPLRVLRVAVEDEAVKRDPLRLLLITLVGIGIIVFAIRQTGDLQLAAGFAAGVGAVFVLLYGMARLVMYTVRRFFPASWPYVWRQGLANLYRPNNQTALILVALGLGTFLIMTLYLTQTVLLSKISALDRSGEANVILFDVQPHQVAGVESIVDSLGLKRGPSVPVVTMRLTSVRGRRVADILADSTHAGPRWALRREYRSTYRSELTETERITAGTFTGNAVVGNSPVSVSLEQDIALDLGVDLGDELTFDVQGLEVKTEIGSIREVDWQRVSTNFFVVFPLGVLEEAPQFHVITAHADVPEDQARLQNTVVRSYPNVSTIDLDQIFSAVERILDRLAFVVRFMAMFSVLTGLLVLVSSVMVSRYQRIKDSILLRTIGASSRQLLRILATEYILLGCLAAATGSTLAIGASWSIARWVFEAPYVLPLVPIMAAFVIVTILTVTIGLANSREIVRRPPLEVLRTSVG